MSTSYICSTCRHKIVASTRCQGQIQLRYNSIFVILGNLWGSMKDTVSKEIPPIGAPHESETRQSEVKYRNLSRKIGSSRIRSEDVLDSLFEEGRQAPDKDETLANRPAFRHLVLQKESYRRPIKHNSRRISQKLSRALAERSLKEIDNLWAEAKSSAQSMTTSDQEAASEGTGPAGVSTHGTGQSLSEGKHFMSQELCNQFILSYMGMRQPQRAFDIWNYMVDTSRTPTLSTWHAMLEGCKQSRNEASLNAVWAKLRSSGVQPDVACWRTRISALIDCGKLELGIRALEEMGREWQGSTKKMRHLKSRSADDNNGAVKPTIETINDAISGLLNRGYLNAAKSILAWGDDFGIKPDVVTFNILLRGLVRDGNMKSVPSLLAEMQSQGIQADVATFTTILDEVFNTSDPMSQEEQIRLTNLIFAEMEAAGIQPNRFTYNKIISSLVLSQPNDMSAVQAVLARMAAQKIEPSRDIYTMLVQHLFSRRPPDLGGVRSLLDRIRDSDVVLDHIFWDRVIEGYASIGDAASALAVLGRVDAKGAMAGWPALEMVLRALVANGEVEMARQVVRNVMVDRGGPPNIDQKGKEGQHSFWNAVAELGLMSL